VQIAGHDGRPIVCPVTLFDLNRVLRRLTGARSFPLGILRPVALKWTVTHIKIVHLGVVLEWHGLRVETLFYHRLFEVCRAQRVVAAEYSGS